nr:MAG TPA: hypothetical protein [Caudoviricetes sp.]
MRQKKALPRRCRPATKATRQRIRRQQIRRQRAAKTPLQRAAIPPLCRKTRPRRRAKPWLISRPSPPRRRRPDCSAVAARCGRG